MECLRKGSFAPGRAPARLPRRWAGIDARLDLMRQLVPDFDIVAVGTSERLGEVFAEAGFSYRRYPMSRGVNPLRDA